MIKIIAFITMLFDHIFEVHFSNLIILRILGRFSFPLFAWEIAQGFKRTSNIRKYAVRLLMIVIISQFPHYLLFRSSYLNVCFTLLAGLIVLLLYETQISVCIKLPAILCLSFISHLLNFEYGIYGIATIGVFYLFEGKYYLILIQTIVTFCGIIVYRYYPIQLISIVSIIIISCFEKYDFKINRIVNYGFYPVHIIILLLISYFIPIR